MTRHLRRALALVVAVAAADDRHAPDANAGVLVPTSSIVVDSAADTNVRDGVVTLREAILLATGGLAKASLTASEVARVTFNPGPSASDTITFDPTVFPVFSQTEIHTDEGFPPLSTGLDVVRGGGAVRITCGSVVGLPFFITSSGNAVSGFEIDGCNIGVLIRNDADDNVVGGVGEGQGNVLLNNGIAVSIQNLSANPDRNRVVGNHIGVRRNAIVAAGNNVGVAISRATGSVIEDNVISGNAEIGVALAADDCIVRGNRIGTNTAGFVAVPNGVGVSITAPAISNSASRNVVGGVTEAERNLISGNTGAGVEVKTSVAGQLATNNAIIGNHIGVTANGLTPLPNGTGVRLEGHVSTFAMGGTEPGAGNLIAFNAGAGLSIVGDEARQIGIFGNVIHSNGALGIDLGADGVTPNDDTDATATGPNGFQNFPVLTAVSYAPAEPPAEHGMLVVEGMLQTEPLEGDLTVHVFASSACDPSGHGEAELPLPALTTTGLTTEADGSVAFVASAEMPVPALRVLTATTTSDERGTSELSACAMLAGVGEPCDGDAACDDGDACTGVETCVDEACRAGTPVACDDGAACNGVATCVAGSCQAGAPLDCDDAETCTDDTCDDALGCANTPLAGVPSVTCRLDTMADLLAATELPDALRRKLEKRLAGARGKLESSSQLDDARRGRVLRKARKLLAGVRKLAVRQRGKKLPEESADAIAAAADDALRRLETLATAAPPDSAA